MTLRDKTIHGLAWSLIDNFAKLSITFLIGIILARLLTPREFGLVGMVTIFVALSQSFIDSGFTQALIRKKDCTQTDYSTVFFFNIASGIFFYLVLFLLAKPISQFFNEIQLKLIVQVLGLNVIINSLAIVQRARLTKDINFKLQARISIISTMFSGGIAIWMAYSGYGVWSLVIKSVMAFAFTSFLLWLWNKWKPSLIFSKESFRGMFSFGSKLLLSGLIDTTYRNIYLVIIGKFFSAIDLGYYTRAEQFANLPSQNILSVIQRVSYPVLSSIQFDKKRLKAAYQTLIKSTMLITFVLMFGMAAIAEPLVRVLIGEKWLPSVVYLQLLCFVGMFYPLHALNLNMLNVQGRSDLFLKLEVIKKTLAVPVIIFGIVYGIKILILGMIILSIIALYFNSYWSGKLIGYSFFQQIKDIIPSFILALLMGLIVFSIGTFLNVSPMLKLITQIPVGALIFIGIAEAVKLNDYLYMKVVFFEKLKRRK